MKTDSANFLNPVIANRKQLIATITGVIQLLLIAGIAILLMLDIQHLAITLSRLNLVYVGIQLFYLCISQIRILSAPSIATLIICSITANILSYDNNGILYISISCAVVFALLRLRSCQSLTNHQPKKNDSNEINANADNLQLSAIILLPIAFNLLHITTQGCLCTNEDTWTMWYGCFIILGICLLTQYHLATIAKYARKLFTTLLFIYVFLLAQIPVKGMHLADPFQFFGLSLGYDYRVNTFYLAIYAAIALVFTIYLFFSASKPLKIACIVMSLVLAYFILLSSWRPIWLGLIFGSLFTLLLANKQMRIKLILGMLILQGLLFTSNIGNYADRFIDLAHKISTEERTIIWQDAWQMQAKSTPQQWLYGHGLNSFVGDFKQFSRFYREKNINFRSPHNVVLDVLYVSGIIGLLFFALVIYYLFFQLIKITRHDKNNAKLACAVLCALTVSLLANGLNHGLFTRISFYPLCFIFGCLIFMQHNNNSHSNEASKQLTTLNPS